MNLNFDEFIEVKQAQQKPKEDYPRGFKPGVEWNGNKGQIITKGLLNKGDLDWDEWIDYWIGKGASKTFYIKKDEPINFRVWDAYGRNPKTGESEPTKFYYFKTNLYSRENSTPDKDIQQLANRISKIKPKPKTKVKVHQTCLVVSCSDWQVGKKNTEQSVLQYFDSIYAVKNDLKNLRKKYTINKLVICGLGDLVENCSNNFYPMGLYEQEFDNRQQMRIARRMLTKTIEILAPLFTDVIVMATMGNHGERRQGGKANTSFGDNMDVELFDSVEEIFSKSPAFKHIKWYIPDNYLTTSVQVLPNTVLSIAHGHQARGGGNAQQKVVNWFTKMSSNKTKAELYDTDVLLVGHFHHHFSVEVDHRLVLCSTAYDLSGQQWFSEQGGGSALHGVTAFLMHNKEGRKWSDINIY